MDSIGATLKAEREKRGLSLDEAHETTKITVQNITALEEDRFDSFPNKVYARAFLRDYANFLGLDSGELLTVYEDKWSPKPAPEPVRLRKAGSFWRACGYTALTLVVAAGLGTGGYFGWHKLQHERKAQATSEVADTQPAASPEGAVIPKAPPVTPPKLEVAKPDTAKPATTPKPPAPVVAPQTQALEVATLAEVWVRIVTDGKTAFIGILPKGQTKTFQGKTISVRAGKAGALQLKLNGQTQPLLEGGSLKVPGEKTFTMPPAASTTTPTKANTSTVVPVVAH